MDLRYITGDVFKELNEMNQRVLQMLEKLNIALK